MSDNLVNYQASDDFNKARVRARFGKILNIIKPEKQQLLSFDDVKNLVRPTNQVYRGMQVVSIKDIVGSEGRYSDFNKAFLPRHDHLRKRWESIDKAHLKQVILPPIKLYKIGDVYFVRDGNHRVSVAKQQKVEAIDAEVTELSSHIKVTKDMTIDNLRQAIIMYERQSFMKYKDISSVIDMKRIDFTATGRYDELIRHIHGHKYFINMGHKHEISLKVATKSWFDNIFLPILEAIKEEDLLSRFPGRTEADLYVWIVRHWDELKRKYGDGVSVKDAARDYSQRYGKGFLDRLKDIIVRIFKALKREG
ncbi:hypothetical protein [Spirochaeta cellobiosiphila]|uniref:hypothetical protein n=1 Tax=Spirochaeta cellobiosiphila TaxID=504483 RepID=UPI00040BD25C|nr:hypothetical protein [Spirochaeta cellobiosiphila]